MRYFFLVLCIIPIFGFAQGRCDIKDLQKNLAVEPAVIPEKGNSLLVQSTDATKVVSSELRVACIEADLLKLGFAIRAYQRVAPIHSTGASYEEITIYQREEVAVRCYQEYALDKPGPEARPLWSRSACQQIVPIRLVRK